MSDSPRTMGYFPNFPQNGLLRNWNYVLLKGGPDAGKICLMHDPTGFTVLIDGPHEPVNVRETAIKAIEREAVKFNGQARRLPPPSTETA